MKTKIKNTNLFLQNQAFIYLAAITSLILSIPLVAMQFATEVNWALSDFIVMGTLIFGTGSLFIFLSRIFPKNKVFIGITLIFLFLWLWVELAVGLFTNWGS